MTPYEIPLSPEPQTFSIELNGVSYRMTVYWNPSSGCWILDIRDAQNADVLLGIPIVTGVDLLGQYDYLGFGGSLVAQTDHDPLAAPTYDNLGQTGHLYFVVE
jgi:hypothetical protein